MHRFSFSAVLVPKCMSSRPTARAERISRLETLLKELDEGVSEERSDAIVRELEDVRDEAFQAGDISMVNLIAETQARASFLNKPAPLPSLPKTLLTGKPLERELEGLWTRQRRIEEINARIKEIEHKLRLYVYAQGRTRTVLAKASPTVIHGSYIEFVNGCYEKVMDTLLEQKHRLEVEERKLRDRSGGARTRRKSAKRRSRTRRRSVNKRSRRTRKRSVGRR